MGYVSATAIADPGLVNFSDGPTERIWRERIACIEKSTRESMRTHELIASCSCTSRALQKGRQSTERKEKEDSALRPLERFVGLLMTELIGPSKSRCLLADLQAKR